MDNFPKFFQVYGACNLNLQGLFKLVKFVNFHLYISDPGFKGGDGLLAQLTNATPLTGIRRIKRLKILKTKQNL